MVLFGEIKSYDSTKGTGMISPENGGSALPFHKFDLQQEAQVPHEGERYGYELKVGDYGRQYAIKLAPQQGEPDARSNTNDNKAQSWENEGGSITPDRIAPETIAASLGVVRHMTETYSVGGYRYTTLTDAIAQARRMEKLEHELLGDGA